MAYVSLRRDKLIQVRRSRWSRFPLSDQGEIWEELAHKSARLGVRSSEGAMDDLFSRYRLEEGEIEAHFPLLENQVSYLAYIREGFAAGDVFGSPSLFRARQRKLVRSLYLDLIDRAVHVPPWPRTRFWPNWERPRRRNSPGWEASTT